MRVKTLWLGLLILAFSFTSLLSQELLDRINENFTGVETVSIKGSFCKTEIVTGSDAEVALEGEIRSVRRYQDLRIRYAQTGSHLDIWIEHPRNTTGQIRGLIRLTVPAQTLVEVSNLSGSISVDGLGSNTTTLETLSGNVDVKNIMGPLKVKTASGNINGALLGGRVSVQAVSGNISMKDVQGECQLTSISGNVRVSSALNGTGLNSTSGNITLSDALGNVEIRTASGEIFVSRLKGNAVVTSSSGGIRVEEVIGQLDLTTISGTIKGEQVMLTDSSNFRNGSGNIDMALGNDPETLSFKLKSVSGRIDLYGLMAEKQLTKGEGPVRITGATTSGNQSYR